MRKKAEADKKKIIAKPESEPLIKKSTIKSNPVEEEEKLTQRTG